MQFNFYVLFHMGNHVQMQLRPTLEICCKIFDVLKINVQNGHNGYFEVNFALKSKTLLTAWNFIFQSKNVLSNAMIQPLHVLPLEGYLFSSPECDVLT